MTTKTLNYKNNFTYSYSSEYETIRQSGGNH